MSKLQIKNSMLLLLAAAIWGFAFVAQSLGMDYIEPFTFTMLRSLIGGVILIPCIFLLKIFSPAPKEETNQRDAAKNRNLLIKGGVCCGLLLALACNLQQIGIKYTTVGRAGFITACYIIIVPILGVTFFKRRCRASIWLAVFLALAGLYLLCMKDSFHMGKGDFYIFVGSVMFALHILAVDHFSPMVDGVKMSCIQFFVCGLVSGILTFIFETPDLSSISQAWAPVLYAGILSCGVAYTLQIIGQKDINPTVASVILSMESCISVLAGWVLLNQKLSNRESWGCVFMFAAIILAQLPEKKRTANSH